MTNEVGGLAFDPHANNILQQEKLDHPKQWHVGLCLSILMALEFSHPWMRLWGSNQFSGELLSCLLRCFGAMPDELA